MALLDFTDAPHGGQLRLLPENQTEPAIVPRVLIYHSIVGSAEGAYLMFRDRSNLESHFIVAQDGEVWQLIDTTRQADANLDANAFAISVETEDRGDPDSQPWTAAQLDSLAWIAWRVNRLHAVPLRRCPAWNSAGIGYHTLFGSPSHWTPVAKSCPGRVRIRQFDEVLLPRIVAGEEASMALSDADKQWITGRLEESERRVARYVDHGDATQPGSANHHVKVREDVAAVLDAVTAPPTPVPVVVDEAAADAIAQNLAANSLFLQAIANAVADEAHQRGAE